MLAATVDFPTPPLPEEMAMIRPKFGWGAGVEAEGGVAGTAPVGGPCVTLAGPSGFDTEMRIPSRRTPSTPWTALLAWRTRVAGSLGPSRKVKLTSPAE